jgi:hypothetical protein
MIGIYVYTYYTLTDYYHDRNTRSMVLAMCQLMVYLQVMRFATTCATLGSKLEKMTVSLAYSKIQIFSFFDWYRERY